MSAWWNGYVGIPFREDGRDRSGCDCWGLARLVAQERFGRCLPSWAKECDPKNIKEAAEAISGHLPEFSLVPLSEAREGDLMLFTVGGQPCHIGTVISTGRMLHIQCGVDACVESYRSPRWVKRIEGVYRHG
ncbi:MAG: NlpC/P60 family protein [Desulfovibrionaceae bacterium]|nr:NlpC/P60 family protein [Desulfovibrionaceae bacterium]